MAHPIAQTLQPWFNYTGGTWSVKSDEELTTEFNVTEPTVARNPNLMHKRLWRSDDRYTNPQQVPTKGGGTVWVVIVASTAPQDPRYYVTAESGHVVLDADLRELLNETAGILNVLEMAPALSGYSDAENALLNAVHDALRDLFGFFRAE